MLLTHVKQMICVLSGDQHDPCSRKPIEYVKVCQMNAALQQLRMEQAGEIQSLRTVFAERLNQLELTVDRHADLLRLSAQTVDNLTKRLASVFEETGTSVHSS